MKHLFFVFCILTTELFAANMGNVIHVTRKLRMSYNDPMPPKEFFVDLGERDGVKVGDVLEVYRMVPVVNSMSGGPWHLMKVSLGEMTMVFVGESTSIGRQEKERAPASLPAMEYQSIMLGDQVQIKAAPLPFH